MQAAPGLSALRMVSLVSLPPLKVFAHRSKHPELYYLSLPQLKLLTVSHALLLRSLDKVLCPSMHEIYPDISSITAILLTILLTYVSNSKATHNVSSVLVFPGKTNLFLAQSLRWHMFLDRMQHILNLSPLLILTQKDPLSCTFSFSCLSNWYF